MSGMRFALDQLNPAMRAQAQRKIDQLRAVSTERTVICAGEKPVAGQMVSKPGPASKTLGDGVSGKRGFPVRALETAQAVREETSVTPDCEIVLGGPKNDSGMKRQKSRKNSAIPSHNSGVLKPLDTNFRSSKERVLYEQMRYAGLEPQFQFRWHPERKFRADFAFPAERLLIEVQGAVYTNGAHTRGSGYQYDRRRNNEAVVLGWRMLEFTPADVKSGHALYVIKRALGITKTEGTCSPSWNGQQPQEPPSTRTPSSG